MNNTTSALFIAIFGAAASAVISAPPDLSKLPPAAKQEGVTYAKDIKPIFESSCFRCHGAERPKAGLRLDSLEGVLKGSREEKVVVPGKSQDSPLVIAVARLDEENAMPPKPRGRRGGGGPGGTRPGTPSDGAAPTRPDGGARSSPGGTRGPMGPPAKPLTAEQVSLIRAWVDQGAK